MNQEIIKFLEAPNYESSALQIVKLTPSNDLNAKNLEISRVYNGINKDIRYLLSRLTHEEARRYLVSYTPIEEQSTHNVVFEFVCIMCSLRLSIYKDCRIIELDTDYEIKKWIGGYNYDQLLRAAYRATMWETTQYNIEGCLQVNTEKVNHYDYWTGRLLEGETLNTSLLIEPPTTGIEDLLI
ncbi:hypothetical protein [Mucilaginibacter sp.]|uniref:hypothetical protein n=1 Tax=Mucilaginibacter sp. TaxID=1882438 RepID=UPI0025F9E850|nr:hypothetical protein [Mucilaginibacter sp.]